MTDLRESNRRGGFYWKGGKPYTSVTNILKAIDKPALRWWFGKEVYLAMVKDPTLDQKQALSAPYQSSDKAKKRGTTVHSIVEAYTKNKKIIETVPEAFKGYAEAFYKWVEDSKVEVLANEMTVVSEKYKYAGTLDMTAILNQAGTSWIIDVKTGKDIYPESGLQLSAYKQALEEYGDKDAYRMGVVLLGENGKYKFQEMEYEFETFLHTKKLWEWMNKKLLEKVKYEGGE